MKKQTVTFLTELPPGKYGNVTVMPMAVCELTEEEKSWPEMTSAQPCGRSYFFDGPPAPVNLTTEESTWPVMSEDAIDMPRPVPVSVVEPSRKPDNIERFQDDAQVPRTDVSDIIQNIHSSTIPVEIPVAKPMLPNGFAACPTCGRECVGRPGSRYCMVCDVCY